MKKYLLLAVALVFLSGILNAQISTPEKRTFNVGAYLGTNVRLVKPFVSADISYKFLTARIMPNFNYNAVGLNAEVIQLSKTFYNLYWNVGVNYGIGTDKNRYDRNPSDPEIISDYTSLQFTTGLRTYFKGNFYSFLLGGISKSKFTTSGFADEDEYLPYIEAGLGFNFWKTYPKLKSEEVEE